MKEKRLKKLLALFLAIIIGLGTYTPVQAAGTVLPIDSAHLTINDFVISRENDGTPITWKRDGDPGADDPATYESKVEVNTYLKLKIDISYTAESPVQPGDTLTIPADHGGGKINFGAQKLLDGSGNEIGTWEYKGGSFIITFGGDYISTHNVTEVDAVMETGPMITYLINSVTPGYRISTGQLGSDTIHMAIKKHVYEFKPITISNQLIRKSGGYPSNNTVTWSFDVSNDFNYSVHNPYLLQNNAYKADSYGPVYIEDDFPKGLGQPPRFTEAYSYMSIMNDNNEFLTTAIYLGIYELFTQVPQGSMTKDQVRSGLQNGQYTIYNNGDGTYTLMLKGWPMDGSDPEAPTYGDVQAIRNAGGVGNWLKSAKPEVFGPGGISDAAVAKMNQLDDKVIQNLNVRFLQYFPVVAMDTTVENTAAFTIGGTTTEKIASPILKPTSSSITAPADPQTVTLYKLDLDAKPLSTGFAFELQTSTDNGASWTKTSIDPNNINKGTYNADTQTVIPNADGAIEIKELVPGLYRFVETDHPAQYKDVTLMGTPNSSTNTGASNSKTFTITTEATEGVLVEMRNELKKTGDLTGSKTWIKDGAPARVTEPGVKFELWRKAGNDPAEKVKEATALVNNQVNFGEQVAVNESGAAYTYYVKEVFDDPTDPQNSNWNVTENGMNVTNTFISDDPSNPNDDKGMLTVKKILEPKPLMMTTFRAAVPEPKKFSFKVTGPYGYEEIFTLAANEEKVLTGLHYGQYSVEETDSQGYVPEFNPGQSVTLEANDSVKTVTVTNRDKTDGGGDTIVPPGGDTPETIGTQTLKKVWVNGPKPDTVIELWRAGYDQNNAPYEQKVGEFTANTTTTEKTFTNLAIDDSTGRPWRYFAKEPNTPANYNVLIDGTTVTNTYVIPKTEEDVIGSKTWIKDGAPVGLTDPEIELQLWRSGGTAGNGEQVESKAPDAMGKANFGRQDATDINGVKYTYYIKEVFSTDVPENDNWNVTENGMNVTNTFMPIDPDTPENKATLTIKKIFDNGEGNLITTPIDGSILSTNTLPDLEFKAKVTGPYGYEKEVTLSTTEDLVLENLYFGEYRVEEFVDNAFTTEYSTEDGKIALDKVNPQGTVTITNTAVGGDVTNRDVVLTKTWKGLFQRDVKDIKVDLIRQDAQGNLVLVHMDPVAEEVEYNVFKYTFNVPIYDRNGEVYEYSVRERLANEDLKLIYKMGEIEGDMNNGFYVTNSSLAPVITPGIIETLKPQIPRGEIMVGGLIYDTEAIEGLHKAYIKGYPEGTVKPEGEMTRAEAVAVVVRLQEYALNNSGATVFSDADGWYNKYINAAYERGILVEKAGKDFRPDEAITRAELAKLIAPIDKANDTVAPFDDVKGHIYEDAIDQAYGNTRILGYPDGTFRPDEPITRAEVATMLNRFYDRKVDEQGIFHAENPEVLTTFGDLNKDYWAYYELMEAANTHRYIRRDNSGIMEDWIRIIKDIVE